MIPVVVGSNPIIHPSFTPVSGYIPVNGPLAQLVEQLTLNQLVEGSNPSRPTNKAERRPPDQRSAFCFALRGSVAALVLEGRATVK